MPPRSGRCWITGRSVDAQEDLLGETALTWAAAENHADIVALLLKAKR